MKKWFLAALLFLTALVSPALSGEWGETDVRVNKGMALVSVFPGNTATSNPLSIRVTGSRIPDNAVVDKVTVVTGKVTKDKNLAGAVVISAYNIKGPGMGGFASKKWAGQGRDTRFDADDLGADEVQAKGTWQLTMTGNNVGRAQSSATHTIRELKIEYRY